jgi:putative aldouronate transport system substrate-binding protein
MRRTSIALAGVLYVLAVAGTAWAAASKEATAMQPGARPKITFMTQTFSGAPVTEDSPVLKALEDYTQTDVELLWVPSTAYGDKLNIMMASGDLPMVVLSPSKLPSVIAAARAGAFWELGPHLARFPNLSQTSPIVNNNLSIDGKVYSLYRSRLLGRMGIVYRADWLRKVGMSKLETIDDFYRMLKGFTVNDPDGDGKADTYGMVVTSYNGPWKIMLTWFGAPNEWGEDASGKLQPAHLFPEYMDALRFWKRMYDEGLINKDFAAYDPGKWDAPFVAEQAGVKVDVADSAGRWETQFKNAGIAAEVGVQGAVAGPKGLRNLPTSGYNGFFVIPKANVKSEADLLRVLTFMDKLDDKPMQDLLGWGVRDRHYVLVNGEIDPGLMEQHPELKPEINDSGQMLMFITPVATPRIGTPVRRLQDKVMLENVKIVVGNPALPLISNVYAEVGAQLDQMVEDARVRYTVGQIDDAGLRSALNLWRTSGGDRYIAEINQLHEATMK